MKEARQKQTDTLNGKLPPQNIDLEEIILGSLLIDQKAIYEIADKLKPEIFYKTEHKEISKVILKLFTELVPIDITTVVNGLKKADKLEEVGGAYYVSTLTNRVATTHNLLTHFHIVLESYMKRRLIEYGHELISKSYEHEIDAFDLIAEAQSKIFDFGNNETRQKELATTELFKQHKLHIDECIQNKAIGAVTGVPTTLEALDKATTGAKPGELIIIASRPGMGKSALAKSYLLGTIIKQKRAAAFYSLEMSRAEILNRLISEMEEIPGNYISSGNLTSSQVSKINSMPSMFYDDKGKELLIVHDTATLSINELTARMRRVNSKYDPAIFVIDYLQLVSKIDKRISKEEHTSEVSRALKVIAKELNKPVVALAQLSREVEKRGGEKVPMLSDLRDSGAIEQDADVVLFIYRPEYYNIREVEFEAGILSSTEGKAQIIIGKQRNGGINKFIPVMFNKELTMFSNYNQFKY